MSEDGAVPGESVVTTASVLWRRLDAPGHDACRLERREDGWTLDGAAVFSEQGTPAWLAYRVTCDREWRAESGDVRGWLGTRAVEFNVEKTAAGEWRLDGAVVALDDCIDLDFGFTPATNLIQLRRCDLAEGQAVDVPVAWLDVSSRTLERLPQRYERRSAAAYWYESSRFGYAALLEVGPTGFVRRYPGLWEAEP